MKKQYATWPSELTPERFAQGAARKGEITCNGQAVYWLQQIPEENGRQVIMRWEGRGQPEIVSPEDRDIGNRVNEYGGGSYLAQNALLYFSDRKTNQVFANHKALTAGDLALADPTATQNGQFLIMVAEKKGNPVQQFLVCVDTQTGESKILQEAQDFYGNPRINTKNKLAYISWQMPNMPWENSTINLADFNPDEAVLDNYAQIDLPGYQSQPTWHGDKLYFISDHETGFGELYYYEDGEVRSVCKNWPKSADMAIPMWNLGQQIYAVIDDNTIAVNFAKNGLHYCGLIKNGKLEVLDLPYIAYGDHLAYWNHKLVFQAATPYESFAVIAYDLKTKTTQVLSKQTQPSLTKEDISVGKPINFSTQDGEQSHAFFYPPKHHAYEGLPDTLPPLIVISHGGPTSSTHAGFAEKIQFWTNRGFAVVDVNYRGSTGYGRAYWQALQHNWGVVDVIDAISATEYLVAEGLVDKNKLLIRGGSAGGFLSLNALRHSNTFCAAAIYFGIADLTAFLEQTHRFEEGYNAWLLGPYPEQKQLYIDRSPINHIDELNTPVIFFHGLEDNVVPPAQSEAMHEALKAKGITTEYTSFPNEGHGFRGAETLIKTLEKELLFYQSVM